MKYVTGLRCVVCGTLYQPDDVHYVCSLHGNEGILDVEYDYDRLKEALVHRSVTHAPGMFAYRPFLPVADSTPAPSLLVGDTPLYEAPRLANEVGLARVWVKDDGRNPTASLKDRASALAVMKAHEQGASLVTTASTGNAAAALAGMAASVGQQSVIFVPAAAPEAKIAQLLVYGAHVLLVEGNYDQAFDLCLEASAAFGWYCRNTAYNPYMAEGKKTVIYELYEQLRQWDQNEGGQSQLLSHIFVSVGDGCIISGVYKGLKDLIAVGWLETMPRLIGVQAAGSSFLYDAWRNGEDVLSKAPIQAQTVADSISAGLPRDRVKAMTAVRQSNGAFVQVTDQEILAAIPALARGSGVFAEPAGAAAYAGLRKAVETGLVRPDARVALLITGNGLKDIGAVMSMSRGAMTVAPTLAAVRAALVGALAGLD